MKTFVLKTPGASEQKMKRMMLISLISSFIAVSAKSNILIGCEELKYFDVQYELGLFDTHHIRPEFNTTFQFHETIAKYNRTLGLPGIM